MIRAIPASMLFFLLSQAFSLLLDLIWMRHRGEHDKDVEIVLLRQQLRILQRKQSQPLRISRWEKLTLVILAGKMTTMTTRARGRLSQVVLLFKPDTLLKWHSELVRRKWTVKKQAVLGPYGAESQSCLLVDIILLQHN